MKRAAFADVFACTPVWDTASRPLKSVLQRLSSSETAAELRPALQEVVLRGAGLGDWLCGDYGEITMSFNLWPALQGLVLEAAGLTYFDIIDEL